MNTKTESILWQHPEPNAGAWFRSPKPDNDYIMFTMIERNTCPNCVKSVALRVKGPANTTLAALSVCPQGNFLRFSKCLRLSKCTSAIFQLSVRMEWRGRYPHGRGIPEVLNLQWRQSSMSQATRTPGLWLQMFVDVPRNRLNRPYVCIFCICLGPQHDSKLSTLRKQMKLSTLSIYLYVQRKNVGNQEDISNDIGKIISHHQSLIHPVTHPQQLSQWRSEPRPSAAAAGARASKE